MNKIQNLEAIAKELRIDTLKMIYTAKSGHIGGCYSAAEMITALYFDILNVDPKDPKWENRDRFILSKGHSAPILYAALAHRGFFPQKDLMRLRMIDSHLQGAPNPKTPGIDMSSGPLGQGLSAAVGMAISARIDKKPYKVWCMVGDGEIQEGQIWEAMMTASKYKLNNLVCILDHNGIQMSGSNEELMPLFDIQKKVEAFGFRCLVIENGNCMEDVLSVFSNILDANDNRPIFVIAETTKGKGVSFMQGSAKWHGTVPNEEEFVLALKELEEN